MIPEKLKEEYRSVTPSIGLRNRVLAMEEPKRRTVPGFGYGLAATALVAVIGFFILWPADLNLSVDGVMMGNSSIAVMEAAEPMLARSAEPAAFSMEAAVPDTALSFTLDTRGKTTVTVTGGALLSEEGEAADTLQLSNGGLFYWDIGSCLPEQSYEIKISGQTNTETYLLTCENGQWYLSQK